MHRHVLTRKGLNLLAKKEMELANPNITKVVAGAGFTDWNALEDMTGLAEPIAEMEIGEKQLVDGKTVRLPVQLSNLELTDTALIRQIGVYSLDPEEGEILYQVVQYELPIPLPAYAANSGGVILFDPELDILFQNGETASTPVTPGFLVTAEAFEDRMRSHDHHRDSHPDIREQIAQILASEVAWEHIPGKPEQFEPAAHTHGKSEITDFPSSLPANGGTADAVPWSGVTGKPASFTPASHTHGAGDMASGTLPVARGGTGATTAAAALTSLGAAAASHNHGAGNITSGTLPIARGGTGATTAAAALASLGAAAASHSHGNATTGAAGFLSAGDKAKLDKCPADVNTALAGKANVTQPTSYSIPYVSGILEQRGVYYKNPFGEVTVNLYFTAAAITSNMPIATLPDGFRPRYLVEVPIVLLGSSNEVGNISIGTNGDVYILRAGSQKATIGVVPTITYLAR